MLVHKVNLFIFFDVFSFTLFGTRKNVFGKQKPKSFYYNEFTPISSNMINFRRINLRLMLGQFLCNVEIVIELNLIAKWMI